MSEPIVLTPHAERLRIARLVVDRYEPLADACYANPKMAADVLNEAAVLVRAEPDALDVLETAEREWAGRTAGAAESAPCGPAAAIIRLCRWAVELLERPPLTVGDFPRWCRQRCSPQPGERIKGMQRVRPVRAYHPAKVDHDTLRHVVSVAARLGIAPPPIEWPPFDLMPPPLATTAAHLCASADRLTENGGRSYPAGRPDTGSAAVQLERLASEWQQHAGSHAFAVCHGSLRPQTFDAACQLLANRVCGPDVACDVSPGIYIVAADGDLRQRLDVIARESVRLIHHDELWPVARRFYTPPATGRDVLASWYRFLIAATVRERIGPLCDLRAFGTVAGSWFDVSFARRQSEAERIANMLAAVDPDTFVAGHWLACPGGINTPATLGVVSMAALRWLVGCAGSNTAARVPPPLERTEWAVLTTLATQDVALLLAELAVRVELNGVPVSERTVRDRLTGTKVRPGLIARGLVAKPSDRGGYVITDAGRDRLIGIRIPD